MSLQAQAHEDALGRMIRSGIVRMPDEAGMDGRGESCVDSVLRSQLTALREENDMLRVRCCFRT